MVDRDPVGRRLDEAALAETAGLGRARLVVDHHGDTRDGGEVLLCLDHPVAVPDLHRALRADWHLGAAIGAHIVGGDEHLGDAVSEQRSGDFGNGLAADSVLTAGHGDRAVVEEFVGRVHPRRDRCLDRELAGVEEGAVADVLDEMLTFNERGHADELRPFGSHGGDAGDVADLAVVHEQDHAVAADAGPDKGVVGDLGRSVVGTS